MSPDRIAVRLSGVGKRYWKLEEQAMLLRSLLPWSRPKRTELWALRDVNVEIAAGETVGIIGRNGAGKTTLLRLLAGVTQPTEGEVLVRGTVAPLISVGVGFHPEMSGRENVHINGMLLGLTRRQVEARFDQIVEFAELERFIDTPVKFYSSGMFMRLGFAVAVYSQPELLLVDEVLAVGDIAFQRKCFDRMREIQRAGTTIVMVSHSMHYIRALCPRTVLVSKGAVEFDGDTEEAIARQHQLLSAVEADGSSQAAAVVEEQQLLGPDGPVHYAQPDQPMRYRARLRFRRAVESPQLLFQVFAQNGVLAYELRTFAPSWRRFEAGETATVEIPFAPRLGGDTYQLLLHVLHHSGVGRLNSDTVGLAIYVSPRPGTIGLADLDARVTVDGERLTSDLDVRLEEARPRPGANQPAAAIPWDGG